MESSDYSILKIYASTTDKIGFELLYEHLAQRAKEKGIAGVTVYRGILGYGPTSTSIDTSRFWELTEKLPVVVEIVDKTEAIHIFYKEIETELDALPNGCLATIEPIEILFQKTGTKRK